MCLMDEALAKLCVPLFVQQLRSAAAPAVRNNIMVALADLVVQFTALVRKARGGPQGEGGRWCWGHGEGPAGRRSVGQDSQSRIGWLDPTPGVRNERCPGTPFEHPGRH